MKLNHLHRNPRLCPASAPLQVSPIFCFLSVSSHAYEFIQCMRRRRGGLSQLVVSPKAGVEGATDTTSDSSHLSSANASLESRNMVRGNNGAYLLALLCTCTLLSFPCSWPPRAGDLPSQLAGKNDRWPSLNQNIGTRCRLPHLHPYPSSITGSHINNHAAVLSHCPRRAAPPHGSCWLKIQPRSSSFHTPRRQESLSQHLAARRA